MGKEYHGSIQLASKGLFNEGFTDGIVKVDPWGTEDERLLISPSLDFEETLDTLCRRCTNLKDILIEPGDLVLPDRRHLFFYMRCLSYGGEYSFSTKCTECGQKFKHVMDLEKDLDVKYADDNDLKEDLGLLPEESLTEPFSFVLPITGKSLSWRMLRGKDEHAVKRYVKRQKQRGQVSDRPDYQYRLALRVVSLDGVNLNIGDAMDLVRSLRGKDALAFRQEIRAVNFGIIDEFEVKCKECGYPNDVALPMDQTFFRPEGRVTKQKSAG